jgi:acetyl esterase/lipase
MASLVARATALGVRIGRIGRTYLNEQALAHHIKHHRIGPVPPSAAMRRRFDVSSRLHEGREVFTIAPKASRTPCPPGRVIYLHGGAYVEGIFRFHWYFIAAMVERLGIPFTVPLYPLAPEHDCVAASTFVLDLYRELVGSHGGSQLAIMGDSAGGGLAASISLQAVAAGIEAPAALVLLSPWLDVTMTDPEQVTLEKVDPLLCRKGPEAAGRWYAGALPTTDPRVSPLYGDIGRLPPTLMFCGTHDILVTDARRLVARAAAAGTPVEYHEEDGLMHAYPLLFFPESVKARERITQFVGNAMGAPRPAPALQPLEEQEASPTPAEAVIRG